MILVWISEFIQVFIPPLAVFFAWIASVLGPAALDGGRGGPYVAPKSVNEQYTGFVSNDGTSVRGKKNKVATKKADQKAMEQLRRIGSVNEARYRHVSVNFMKRYELYVITHVINCTRISLFSYKGITLVNSSTQTRNVSFPDHKILTLPWRQQATNTIMMKKMKTFLGS